MSDSKTSDESIDSESSADGSVPLKKSTQSIVSILVVIHLFCLSICFASVLPTSELGARLLTIFSPYLQFMHFDLDYTPIYMTRETLNEDTMPVFSEREYLIEYLPEGADETDPDAWIQIDDRFVVASSSQRVARLAATAGFFSEEDAVVSRFVRDIARYLRSQQGIAAHKIRIRQHLPVPRERYFVNARAELPDPNDEAFYRTSYTGLVVIGRDGGVDIMKDAPRSETANLRANEEN